MLAGEVEVWIDGRSSPAGPGSFLVVPRGKPHGLRRLTADPVRMLTLISPPGFEKLFDAVVERGEDALLDEPDELVQLAAEFGTEIVGEYPL